MKEKGFLQVIVYKNNESDPLSNVSIEVKEKVSGNTINTLITNEIGKTEKISLDSPPILYTMESTNNKPFSSYDIVITAQDKKIFVENIQIFPSVTALQKVYINEMKYLSIKDPILWGNFPLKDFESPIKLLTNFYNWVILPEVVIPEYIIVHADEKDKTAQNHQVKFIDYIKNVACCEIYPTWPKETIKANVIAIVSYILNRVYTEWYRSNGYDFTITGSTKNDQAFDYERNIYLEISEIVDEVFTTYVTKPDIKQPLLAQYCDGKKKTCPGFMSQWGTKEMGDQGKSALQILKKYYGQEIILKKAKKIEGIPESYPGSILTIGTENHHVKTIQEQLNAISNNYPLLPKIKVDGVYGDLTEKNVQLFQEIFNLKKTGIVDEATWYKISQIYATITKMMSI